MRRFWTKLRKTEHFLIHKRDWIGKEGCMRGKRILRREGQEEEEWRDNIKRETYKKQKKMPGVSVVGDNSTERDLPASRTPHDDCIGMYRKNCIKCSSIICVCYKYLRDKLCVL